MNKNPSQISLRFVIFPSSLTHLAGIIMLILSLHFSTVAIGQMEKSLDWEVETQVLTGARTRNTMEQKQSFKGMVLELGFEM
jgi:hypothetical protein